MGIFQQYLAESEASETYKKHKQEAKDKQIIADHERGYRRASDYTGYQSARFHKVGRTDPTYFKDGDRRIKAGQMEHRDDERRKAAGLKTGGLEGLTKRDAINRHLRRHPQKESSIQFI